MSYAPALNRATCFATGLACGFSFCNPDEGTSYDIFPTHRTTPYAFCTTYAIPDGKEKEFKEKWLALARYYQQQEGYLFTKLMLKKKDLSGETPKYIDLMRWTTADAQARATERPIGKDLVRDLKEVCGDYTPVYYTVAADDHDARLD